MKEEKVVRTKKRAAKASRSSEKIKLILDLVLFRQYALDLGAYISFTSTNEERMIRSLVLFFHDPTPRNLYWRCPCLR
jgi:hypothetical protein